MQVSGDVIVSTVAVAVMGLIAYSVRTFTTSVKDSIAALRDQIAAMIATITELKRDTESDIDEVAGELKDHKVRCHATSNAVLEAQVTVMEKEITSLRKFCHWVSVCLTFLFTKANHDLPPRQD